MKKNTLRKRKKISKNLSILKILLFALLLIYSLILLYPLIWGLMNSFKTRTAYMMDLFAFPKTLYLGNYQIAFKYFTVPVELQEGGKRFVEIPEMFLNSILYAFGSALSSAFISCITAYLVAKFPYRFSRFIYTLVIITMILPIIGSLPSEIHMAKQLNLYDSFYGIWIMKGNFLGIYFLVFYSTFKSMPNDYTEAAYMDGASNFRILFSIYLPLVKNIFMTVVLLQFIAFWNDYQIPMIYLPSHPTVAYGLFYTLYNSTPAFSYEGAKLASSMIVLLPILLVFLFSHKRLLGNITMGGIKG